MKIAVLGTGYGGPSENLRDEAMLSWRALFGSDA